jgi:hypothetical protein
MVDYLYIIQTVGFPVVAFLLMYRLVEGTLKELRAEMLEARKCLYENTKVIALLGQEMQKHIQQKDLVLERLNYQQK